MFSSQISRESLAEDGAPLSQKELSASIDNAATDRLLENSPVISQARLRAVAAPHASAWLQVTPCEALSTRLEHVEFVAATQLWIGGQVLPCDTWCPLCDQVMDTRGSHCLACLSGGDKVRCHNALRDFVDKLQWRQAFGQNAKRVGFCLMIRCAALVISSFALGHKETQ